MKTYYSKTLSKKVTIPGTETMRYAVLHKVKADGLEFWTLSEFFDDIDDAKGYIESTGWDCMIYRFLVDVPKGCSVIGKDWEE